MRKRSPLLITWLAFGFAFLYGPIVFLIVYSFNASDLVTVWTGFSTKWYARLLQDDQILSAAYTSLQVAVITACIAVVLGTLAGMALARYGRFKGRTLFTALITGPLVMPDIVIGLSMLLLFVSAAQAIGIPASRGVNTIVIAHATFCLAYVAVVVQSRLSSMDRSVEEAAQDLGAPPGKVFVTVTLPIIAPALIAGWLLSFTLSLDDLVIASFVSGPGASTLPIVVFSKVRMGVSPMINALATIIVALVTIAVMITGILMARQERRRNAEVQRALRGGG
ncbi:putrescine transport system permease protein [Limimonas halophila]|uniref:Putrescine transport system permease protein n=1 Tax=Limimonas halophila TaxID=1082479 RepID=A0A1G7SAE1_9PROT|nr:ABC transporter permease subunit [Limimonas halophila]SDG19150.1 putrescine transport system permease protein [Limimonas halophila]